MDIVYVEIIYFWSGFGFGLMLDSLYPVYFGMQQFVYAYSSLHSNLSVRVLVWVSVSPVVVDFYFESVYCWDLASVESLLVE